MEGKTITATSLGCAELFDVSESKEDSYEAYINNFRHEPSSNGILQLCILSKKSNPICLLPSSKDRFEYFDIRLSAKENDGPRVTIDCRFAADSLYFIGFRSGEGTWYFLDEWNEKVEVTGLTFQLLKAKVSYQDMEKDISRNKLRVGKKQLIEAVFTLARFKGLEKPNLKRHFLQITQIFCESIRFEPIFKEIFEHYMCGVKLNDGLLKLQTNWSKICKLHGRCIFNEMVGIEWFKMSKEDLQLASDVLVVKQIRRVIYVERSGGLTIDTSDENIEHNEKV